MGALKTKPNEGDVEAFLSSISNERRRREAYVLRDMMQDATGSEPLMYGSSIVGFGSSKIHYADGRTEDWFAVGFSPRSGKFSLYVLDEAEKHQDVLSRLGKHKTGKACLWVNKLDDIDLDVLREIIDRAVAEA
jgi:hypothetical protein